MGDDCTGERVMIVQVRRGRGHLDHRQRAGVEGMGEEEASPGSKSYRERGRTLPPISSRLIGP
jgi:hypothetical protein